MVGIDMIYESRIQLYVDGNIERALNIPDAIKGLDPRFKAVYDKIQDREYRDYIVEMIVKHIMKHNRIYDKDNLKDDVRIKLYMNHVYLIYTEAQLAKLAVACDAKLTETLNRRAKYAR